MLLPIKLFGSFFILLFVTFYFFLNSVADLSVYNNNLIVFHPPIARFSVFLYIRSIMFQGVYQTVSAKLTLIASYFICLSMITGCIWSKIAFGFFAVDSKILAYMLLLFFLICTFFLKQGGVFPFLLGITLLLQERLLTSWVNTYHQTASIEIILSVNKDTTYFTPAGPTVFLLGILIVFFFLTNLKC